MRNIMTTKGQGKDQSRLRLPKRLFLFCLVIGLLAPFVARFLMVPVRGVDWLTVYFQSILALLFISLFSLIPIVAWYIIGDSNKKKPLAFWFSVAGGLVYLLLAHGFLDLSSGSTAGVALVFIPISALVPIVAGWLLGLLAHSIKKK